MDVTAFVLAAYVLFPVIWALAWAALIVLMFIQLRSNRDGKLSWFLHITIALPTMILCAVIPWMLLYI